MNNKNMNIPTSSVDTMVNELGELYVTAINSGMALKAIPSVFLWGAPGVGKSDGVRQIAGKIEKGTGKKVEVTDIRLLLYSPIDLRGVPMADQSREFTTWLRPKQFDLDPSEDVINILFLDELSAAPQSIQAAAYQITLDRTVGEHKLPDNTIILAAGNRTTDKSVAYRMPNALANRMMHFQIDVDFASWRNWAFRNGIHPLILGYLSFDHSKLYCEPQDKDGVAYPTPRSWSFLSNLLYARGIDENSRIPSGMHMTIGGCIGIGAAVEFEGWCNIYRELPSAEDICKGRKTDYPRSQDALYALSASLVHYASKGLLRREVENLCKYAERFPADFKTVLYKDLLNIPEVAKHLTVIPSFRTWMKSQQ